MFLGSLISICFLEYRLYQKVWLQNSAVANIYLFYSPILIGAITISVSLSQFNKRLRELSGLLERKRFISEIESTLRAFGNFYTEDDEKIEAYFSKTIDRLQEYYFKNIGKEMKYSRFSGQPNK
jgi:hypothetical protein